jgi:pimeloyl-ACP methyl ester carboxylesterase
VFSLVDGGHEPYCCHMATFALVHGAWHGAWCWELLTPSLQRAGHTVVAPDLPCDDASATTFDPYADVVCAALDGCDDDVVVVAHSLGGAAGTLVAARRPVRHVVYLCAVVPDVGRSLVDQFGNEPDMVNPDWDKGLSEPDAQSRTVWVDRDVARALLYADCDEDTVASAFDRLRPQSAYPWTVPSSLAEFPSASSTYVVCAEDQLINPVWQRRHARDIGANIVELPGSHSPLLSRPTAVADVLLHIAEK